MKRCPRCGETKPVSEFHKDRANKNGLHSWCKRCNIAYSTAYQKTHRYRYTAMQAQRRLARVWTGSVVTTEAALRHALTLPEPFYALQSTKEK